MIYFLALLSIVFLCYYKKSRDVDYEWNTNFLYLVNILNSSKNRKQLTIKEVKKLSKEEKVNHYNEILDYYWENRHELNDFIIDKLERIASRLTHRGEVYLPPKKGNRY